MLYLDSCTTASGVLQAARTRDHITWQVTVTAGVSSPWNCKLELTGGPTSGTADYINFIKQVTPETTQEYMTQLKRFNMGSPGESDCPVFDGMYEYFAVRVSYLSQRLTAAHRCNGHVARADHVPSFLAMDMH